MVPVILYQSELKRIGSMNKGIKPILIMVRTDLLIKLLYDAFSTVQLCSYFTNISISFSPTKLIKTIDAGTHRIKNYIE